MEKNTRPELFFLIIVFILFFSFSIQASEFYPDFYFVYEVVEGDTLGGIAQRFGTSVAGLRWANGLGDDLIRLGDELIIPQKPIKEIPSLDERLDPNGSNKLELERVPRPVYIRPPMPEVDLPRDKVIIYQIRSGDSLYDLAREFNTTTAFLQALNELDSSNIRAGQRIYLPIHNLTPRQAIERTISPEEKDILARAIHAEARGEPFIGQVAVGAVIINRVLSPNYPDTFRGVIFQPGQFCVVRDGQINLSANQQAIDAAREALRGNDPTRGAIYYYNPDTATNTAWLQSREVTAIIGNHVFAR